MKIIVFIFASLMLFEPLETKQSNSWYCKEIERLGYLHVEKFAEQIKNSKNLEMNDYLVAEGKSRIHYFVMYFKGKNKVTIEEGRKLFLEMANSYVESVNKNELLQKYFGEEGCTMKNLRLNLFFEGVTAEDFEKGCIEMVENFDGELSYWYYDEGKPGFREIMRESMQEAVAKL